MRLRWPVYDIPFLKTNFLVSNDAVLHGPLQAACGGRIDGLVKGYVSVTGRLIIGNKAEIKGDVTARSVKVFGKVHGNITCDDMVMVFNTGLVKGDITARIIEVKEGAQVEGVIVKTGDPVAESPLGDETADNLAAEVAAEPVVVVPVRSTDKDKDATNWF